MTFVVAEAVLFAAVGSDVVDVTVTVFVIDPLLVGLTTIFTVTVPPLAIVPMLTETPVLVRVEVPCVVVTELKPAFFGRVSVSITPLAEDGPELCTVIV